MNMVPGFELNVISSQYRHMSQLTQQILIWKLLVSDETQKVDYSFVWLPKPVSLLCAWLRASGLNHVMAYEVRVGTEHICSLIPPSPNTHIFYFLLLEQQL